MSIQNSHFFEINLSKASSFFTPNGKRTSPLSPFSCPESLSSTIVKYRSLQDSIKKGMGGQTQKGYISLYKYMVSKCQQLLTTDSFSKAKVTPNHLGPKENDCVKSRS